MLLGKFVNFIKSNYSYFPYMPWSIYINFRYLPFHKAVKLPIWVYKPRFKVISGKISIEGDVKTGMIRLGKQCVSIYPGRGIMIENRGQIVFKGSCYIGSDSYITVSRSGHLIIGNGFSSYACLSLISHYKVTIKDDVLIGWETKIMDTDFHQLKVDDGCAFVKAFSPVIIGKGVWIAHGCTILHGTIIPDNCVVGAHSLTNKSYSECKEHTLIAGIPAKPQKEGVYLDKYDCSITFDKEC